MAQQRLQTTVLWVGVFGSSTVLVTSLASLGPGAHHSITAVLGALGLAISVDELPTRRRGERAMAAITGAIVDILLGKSTFTDSLLRLGVLAVVTVGLIAAIAQSDAARRTALEERTALMDASGADMIRTVDRVSVDDAAALCGLSPDEDDLPRRCAPSS